jgi:hypothetical protein
MNRSMGYLTGRYRLVPESDFDPNHSKPLDRAKAEKSEVLLAKAVSDEGKSEEYSQRRSLGQIDACGAVYASVPLEFDATESIPESSKDAFASASRPVHEPISIPDPKPAATIEFLNPNPPAFKDLEYVGEYYDAVVPATLDLAERARLAVHGMTSMTNPNLYHEMYFTVVHMSKPPSMRHSQSDLDTQGKFVESTALMRLVSGSKENLHVDRTWMEVLLKMQGDDGLLYTPTTGRDWAMYSHMDDSSGSPGANENPTNHFCLLSFGTARSLAAMCLFAQMDPVGPWRDAASRLAHAYEPLMINKGIDESYLFSTWMYPGRLVKKPPLNPFDESVYLAGTQAWIAQYLVMYDRAFNDPACTRLAERIMNYNMFDRQVNEAGGRFQPSKKGVGTGLLDGNYAHFHTNATNILACLYVYRQTGNRPLLERALESYENGKSKGEPLIGFFPEVTTGINKHVGSRTSETCEVADMVVAALTLARLGFDRCWDDADRWARNQLAENQLTETSWLKDGHLDYSRSQVPPDFFKNKRLTTDLVTERTLGGFAGWPSPNDWVSAEDRWGGDKQNILSTIMNCCTASGSRALFALWRDMLSYENGILKLNLLFNRASKWVDIDSFIPYAGKVELKVKESLQLEVRIPEWSLPGEAKCEVDGRIRELAYKGRYARIGRVGKGGNVRVTFPISERTEKRNIEGFDYNFIMRGNDVVQVDPPGRYCPLYQRAHFRTGKPLYRKVKRFVALEEVAWW